MNTHDLDSGKSRGWVSAKAASGAPGRITAPPVGGKLLPKLIGAVVVVLLIGALFGGADRPENAPPRALIAF